MQQLNISGKYADLVVFSSTCTIPNTVWNTLALILDHSEDDEVVNYVRLSARVPIGKRDWRGGVYGDSNTFITFVLSTEMNLLTIGHCLWTINYRLKTLLSVSADLLENSTAKLALCAAATVHSSPFTSAREQTKGQYLWKHENAVANLDKILLTDQLVKAKFVTQNYGNVNAAGPYRKDSTPYW
jgi:hypothetical protein